ncbi:MAG: hypothetical protein EA384_03355 [Spirochaetaceae bacterium]|nr:MAG: hypothetical protein EA384_03355 [Spirochaetaceae bacterium]
MIPNTAHDGASGPAPESQIMPESRIDVEAFSRHRSRVVTAPPVRTPAPSGICLLAALALLLAAPRASALQAWHDQHDERTLRVAEDADYAGLLENPRVLAFDAHDHPADEIYAVSFADLHAVYPVEFEALRDTILDLGSHGDFVPRVVSSAAEPAGDNPPKWRQHVELEFRVLVFRSDYSFETKHMVVRDKDREFALLFRMLESHDALLADSGGSWYLKRIEIDGLEHTYVRYFNHVAFGRRVFGLRFALRNFGLRDVKSVMNAYYEETLRRNLLNSAQ